MSFKGATAFVMDNPMYFIIGFGVLIIITYAIMINLWLDLSYMKARYRKMMAGVEGGNLERLINGQVDDINMVISKQKEIQEDMEHLDSLLKKAITRISVVRFDAFEDVGSDLSYCVAMLDSNNNGIVISGIFGREDSRTYVKPIVDGESSYKLTQEEERALKDAMNK
ncbi:MAG: DUF4446 family protein [Selenomonadaceae bacterium]|nr:DUF4446 family protein [Selenomonadaceae bacterium]MBR1857995.1 DUF4446 family protein [Selenomonadaceae bacterium]